MKRHIVKSACLNVLFFKIFYIFKSACFRLFLYNKQICLKRTSRMNVDGIKSSSCDLFSKGKFIECCELLQSAIDNCHLKRVAVKDEVEFILLRNNLLVCNCLVRFGLFTFFKFMFSFKFSMPILSPEDCTGN